LELERVLDGIAAYGNRDLVGASCTGARVLGTAGLGFGTSISVPFIRPLNFAITVVIPGPADLIRPYWSTVATDVLNELY
jgi:hypothetical protein